MTLPPTAWTARRPSHADRKGFWAAGLVAACLVAALLPVNSGTAGSLVPCPGALPGPVTVPPRVGLAGAAATNSQDSAVFEAPIGPGQTLTLHINVSAQFIATGAPLPYVEYQLLRVKGTQPAVGLVMCDPTPLLSGTLTPTQNIGFSAKKAQVSYVLSAPNPGDDPYPILDFVVRTNGSAFADWSITLQPCGYPCIEPILFPGPCDPVTDPRTCM